MRIRSNSFLVQRMGNFMEPYMAQLPCTLKNSRISARNCLRYVRCKRKIEYQLHRIEIYVGPSVYISFSPTKFCEYRTYLFSLMRVAKKVHAHCPSF